MFQIRVELLLVNALNFKIARFQCRVLFRNTWRYWLILIVGALRDGQSRLLPILSLNTRCVLKCLYFIVAEESSNELELDNADLVEKIITVVVTLMKDKFEVLTADAEMHRFELSRLEAGLLVTIQREVTESFE